MTWLDELTWLLLYVAAICGLLGLLGWWSERKAKQEQEKYEARWRRRG